MNVKRMFELQRQLNEKIGCEFGGLSDEQKAKWVNEIASAISQEAAELRDSVPWKFWAKYQEIDLQNSAEELIDVVKFAITGFLALGLDEKDFARMFELKHLVNMNRQANGYTTKDENDSKHI